MAIKKMDLSDTGAKAIEAMREEKIKLRSKGLNRQEIREYINLKFGTDTPGFRDQLRTYYFIELTRNRANAEKLWEDLSVFDFNNPTETCPVIACEKLSKYFDMPVLFFEGKQYAGEKNINFGRTTCISYLK
jgi:hypothetical protein